MPTTIDVLSSPFLYLQICKRFEFIRNTNGKPKFKNDYEYVDYTLDILSRNISTPLINFPNELEGNFIGLKKDTFEAIELRNLGNKMFRENQMHQALNFYTFSIALAKDGSEELGLAYANRSAVLFEKQYFKESLEDIARAFENKYPEQIKNKLQLREARAKELLSTQKKEPYHDKIPVIKHKNTAMESAADCVKIDKNQVFGRHIVATRHINAGEIILVEKPYSQFVFPETRIQNCSECFELCHNLIPCERCSGVMFCSKQCRRKAFVDYHRYECVIMQHYGFNLINWTATRTTLKGLKEYGNVENDNGIYCSSRYKEISQLTLHEAKDEMSAIICRTAGVAKVFYALKKYTDFFSEFDVENKENVLKEQLLKDVGVVSSNSCQIKQFCSFPGLHFNIGKALYSTLSMFNHSCCQNMRSSFYGSTVVLRAEKKIKKGEQCFINYGCWPVNDLKTDRQRFLKESFYFTCKCKACKLNWPKIEVFPAPTVPQIIELEKIYVEVCKSPTIDRQRKHVLLQRCFKVQEKLGDNIGFTIYGYLNKIFSRLLVSGNVQNPF